MAALKNSKQSNSSYLCICDYLWKLPCYVS